jgi:transposase-like protein
MAGTIFEHSSTSLHLWFEAIYLMSSTRCGVSAKHLERELGVTYKTAWRMFHQIRKLLVEDSHLEGVVEVDETFIGGKAKHPFRGRSTTKKAAVFGMVERGGRVVAKVVPHTGNLALLPHITARVLPNTMIYSDEWTPYNQLGKMGYQHRRIHHLAKVYVNGDVHTNTIEGFWSLLKRGIGGAHHAVSRKYLQTYLDEFCFRYNHRSDERPMFLAFLENVRTASALASGTPS